VPNQVNRSSPICVQHFAVFGEKTILLCGQLPLDLAFGDRHADRMQQRRQAGQGGLALMILHQHEAAQVGAEMSVGSLGRRCHDRLAGGCRPPLAAVANGMYRQHKPCTRLGVVALEA